MYMHVYIFILSRLLWCMPHGRTADTILFSKLNTPLDPLLLQGGLEDLWYYYYECSVHETVFLIVLLLLLL